MKIYFSSSPSFFIKNKELYPKIVQTVSELGGNIVPNWMADKHKLTANKLFNQTIIDIKNADLLIAEISHPSTGVGQQIALAIFWKIPVIALRHESTSHNSRFTVGTKSDYLTVINYTSDTLKKLLVKNLEKIKKSQFVKFNFVTTREINDYLIEKSKENDISKSEYLRKIVERWIKHHS